jgi:hypothetical protein
MDRFRRTNNAGNNKGLQRSKPKQRHILQTMYCLFAVLMFLFISLTACNFTLSQHLHSHQNQQHSQFLRSKEERKKNNLPLISHERTLYNQISSGGGSGNNNNGDITASNRKPRVIAITSLQYDIPSKSESVPSLESDSDPPPIHVLVPNSKLLALDTTSLATNKAFDFTESSMPTSGDFIEPSWYTPNAQDFLRANDRCEVMYQWQLEGFPNCNDFHELDMAHMKMINSGGSRTAFEMNQHLEGGMLSKFVYKAPKFNSEVSMHRIDEQRKDALVLERATSSNFIPNIHGYCSAGVLMEFASEGDMNAYLKGARLAKRKGGDESLSPVDRLRVAIHIASSVRDLHEIGDVKEIPAFYHNDICCHQYLFQDGMFKLNDFNYAQPMTFAKKNTTENEICLHESSGMGMWKHRSFEEHLLHGKDVRLEPFSGDKTDIYMMGNLMYTILTDLYLYEKPELLNNDEATKALLAGKRSPYPEDIEKSIDPAHVAVKTAIEMCWIEKWNRRPSARSIADYLMGQLRVITKEEHPDLRVTLPARDPDQKRTESDFNANGYN